MATARKKASVKKAEESKTPRVRRSLEERVIADFQKAEAAYMRAKKRFDKAVDEFEKAEAGLDATEYEYAYFGAHPALPEDMRPDLSEIESDVEEEAAEDAEAAAEDEQADD